MASKFFYDCEFLEGAQQKRFLGFSYGETKPTIDLISIGMVDLDGREFFALSKDFNLEEAWFRYDLTEKTMFDKLHGLEGKKIYWIRENVLKPIFYHYTKNEGAFTIASPPFKLREMKRVIEEYGQTNLEISIDLKKWVYSNTDPAEPIEFYGYYSAYDHVCLSWLYGKMINLPSGFPMYTRDLKQIIDENAQRMSHKYGKSVQQSLTDLKNNVNYPAPFNEHDALSDARFNRQLYKFLENLQQ